MMNRILAATIAAGLTTALTGPAAAQDDGLYPEPSAPDASFLRVMAEPAARVTIDGGRPLEPGANGMTPYVEIAPGPVTVSVDARSTTVEAEANRHYTWLPEGAGGEGRLLSDAVTGSAGSADLLFYNLTDLPEVDLHVPEADVVALPAVAAGEGAGAALRAPLTLGFEARADGATLAAAEAVEMRQRTGTSIVLTGTQGEYALRAATNAYGD